MYQTNAPWSWGQINALESQINRHSAIVHWYAQWGLQSGVFNPTVVNLLNGTRAHGSLPMVTWEPWSGGPVTQNPYPLTQITSGTFDGYIDSWASGLLSYGHPVILRFGHEMNGNWYPWGAGVNGNTPGSYIAAYRHVHDRFALKGVRNVQWVFSPDGDPYGSEPAYSSFYPGDAYVDWLAADVYNWGTTQSWSSWQPISFLYARAYSRLTALNASKPLMLGEWASKEQGGNKGAWIVDAASTIPRQFPRTKAVVWFSQNGDQFALDSSAGSLSAARSAFGASPYCLKLAY
jgi:glycosyl hydrolase family 26